MTWLVLFTASLNVLLGSALAVLVRRQELRRAAPRSVEQPESPQPEAPQEETATSTPSMEDIFPADDELLPEEEPIPQQWLDRLAELGLTANSFVEASMQVLRLEVGQYREQLIEIEAGVRLWRDTKQGELSSLLETFSQLHNRWLAQQQEAARQLSDRRGQLGLYEAMAENLVEVLTKQQANIEQAGAQIAGLKLQENSAAAAEVVAQLCQLIDLAHSLRDAMQQSLVSVFREEKRLDEIDRRYQFDPLTRCFSLSGLEVMFHQWWRGDSARQRFISCALIDLDNFAAVNKECGTAAGDRVLAAFSGLLVELVRRDRGFDRAARFSGQQFLLFLGDTGPRNATAAAERIRQTLEASSLELTGRQLDLTVSCGVTEVESMDKTVDIYRRLRQALAHAKQKGRNQTCLADSEGLHLVDPPQYQVKGRLIPVAE